MAHQYENRNVNIKEQANRDHIEEIITQKCVNAWHCGTRFSIIVYIMPKE